MDLRNYLDRLPRGGGADLARRLQTTHVYLCQLANGARRASPAMAMRIQQATDGAVTALDLRPDLAELLRGLRSGGEEAAA